MFHTTINYTLPRYILSITAENHKHRQKYPVLKGTQIINPFFTLMEDFFGSFHSRTFILQRQIFNRDSAEYPVHKEKKCKYFPTY